MLSDASPLVPARRRYGSRAFGLGVLALGAIALAVVAQSPPTLRGGGVALALILVAICSGVSMLSFVWAGLMVWPAEQRRLRSAQPIRTRECLSAPLAGMATPLTVLIVGGLLVGILLWAFLSTVGLVGAPMLWLVVGTINLEVARRARGVEGAEHVTYYETPIAVPFRRARAQEVFVLLPAAQRERRPSRSATRKTGKARTMPPATAEKAKG